MPEYTTRLNLPKPLGNENVSRQAHNELVEAIDAAAATKEDLDDHVADQTNPHNVTASQVGAIPTTQKGAANGVATLDSGGTIPDAQIPATITRDTELTAHTSRTDNPHATTALQLNAAESKQRTAVQLQDPTSLRSGIYTNSGDGLFNADGTTYLNGSSISWWHVIHSQHFNNNGYASQIAIPLSTAGTDVYHRRASGTTWGAWTKFWDSLNFNPANYLATAGGTMSQNIIFNVSKGIVGKDSGGLSRNMVYNDGSKIQVGDINVPLNLAGTTPTFNNQELWHNGNLRTTSGYPEIYMNGAWEALGNKIDRTRATPLVRNPSNTYLAATTSYQTILSVSGQKGFIDQVLAVATTTKIVTMRITVDGVVKVVVASTSGAATPAGFVKAQLLQNASDGFGGGAAVLLGGEYPIAYNGGIAVDYPYTIGATNNAFCVSPDPIYFNSSILVEVKMDSGTANVNYMYWGGSY